MESIVCQMYPVGPVMLMMMSSKLLLQLSIISSSGEVNANEYHCINNCLYAKWFNGQ